MRTETRVPLSRPYLDEREEELVLEVLRSGRLSLGPAIERFEELIGERVGAPYVAAVSSGTAGLHMNVCQMSAGNVPPATGCPWYSVSIGFSVRGYPTQTATTSCGT